jgi:hypothetical protein
MLEKLHPKLECFNPRRFALYHNPYNQQECGIVIKNTVVESLRRRSMKMV